MSFSGVLFVVFSVLAAVNMANGDAFSVVWWVLCSTAFMLVAIYHDDEQEKRIAKLEKEIAKRGNDDG